MSDEEYSSGGEDEATRQAEQRRRMQAEEKKRREDVEKKKAEVRKRLEDAAAKKAKKGFMTPERKKKLRLLLRKKAAEELKKEQERKSHERRRIIIERCGDKKNTDGANEAELTQICQSYQQRIAKLEDEKFDMEVEVENKDHQISELNISVNDLRGKFIKPSLKKVSKYENKFAKLQKKAAEFNFRNQLKTVKKKEFTMEEEDRDAKEKPEWQQKKSAAV
nr:troponin I-like protein 1 [Parasacculina yatsui]